MTTEVKIAKSRDCPASEEERKLNPYRGIHRMGFVDTSTLANGATAYRYWCPICMDFFFGTKNGNGQVIF